MEKSFEKFLFIDHENKTVIYNAKKNIYGRIDDNVESSVKNMLMIAKETGYKVKTSFNDVIFSVTENMSQKEGVEAYSQAFDKKVKDYWQSPEGQENLTLQEERKQERINNDKLSRIDLMLATTKFSLTDFPGVLSYEKALVFVDDHNLRKKENYPSSEELFCDAFSGYRLKEAVNYFKITYKNFKEKGIEDALNSKLVDSIAASFGLPEFFDKNNIAKCKIISPQKQEMTPQKLEDIKSLVDKSTKTPTKMNSPEAKKSYNRGFIREKDITD
ncbi:MAG: hypothetical protein IJ564_03415 [Alphaproteobacteria bacterium]|nr:hypothetical protein [Alphaproteobacteria bacterium]